MAQRIGNYTIKLDKQPAVLGYAAVVGKKEGKGPLGRNFDMIFEDTLIGQKSWEKAESILQREAVTKALEKSGCQPSDMDGIIAGDLLNQCISSTFGLEPFDIPFLGVYGACSTMAESLLVGSMMIDSGAANKCACVTSSHFASSERQFRFPLEYGGQRPPTAQWTVTGSGSVILGNNGSDIRITEMSVGKIVDAGIKDANNMGAAMAKSAAVTLLNYFSDTGYDPKQFDMIATGDLGFVGSQILIELLNREGINLGDKYTDCGLLIYDRDKQDVNSGGSGCGCSASVLCSYILNGLKEGKIKDVLFIATGALMSPTSVQQGESIPGVAHLIRFNKISN